MNVQVRPTKAAEQETKLKVVDCDIHPAMRSGADLKKYLPQRWRDHVDLYGSYQRVPTPGSFYPRSAPYLSRRDAHPPGGGPPGSDLAFMREQYLDPHNVELGILQVLGSGTFERNVEFGAAKCSATNEWALEEWVAKDERLKGSISVTQEYPEAAVAEIKRHANNKGFAQIGLNQRSLEPMGRRRYWPIFEAAVEHNLTVGVHTGGNNGHPPLPGGGWPSFYAEQHHLVSIGMHAVLMSLVMEGVFETFPTLRMILVEGAFSWVPSLMWRLDRLWEKQHSEVPYLKMPPSEYVKRNVWFSTQPMDEMGGPDNLRQVFEWVGLDRLCFASDYPHWDFDDPRYAYPFRMTETEKQNIYNQNAKRAFGLI